VPTCRGGVAGLRPKKPPAASVAAPTGEAAGAALKWKQFVAAGTAPHVSAGPGPQKPPNSGGAAAAFTGAQPKGEADGATASALPPPNSGAVAPLTVAQPKGEADGATAGALPPPNSQGAAAVTGAQPKGEAAGAAAGALPPLNSGAAAAGTGAPPNCETAEATVDALPQQLEGAADPDCDSSPPNSGRLTRIISPVAASGTLL